MRIAVVSLRFAPGHIAHLRAYKELFSAIGSEVRHFVDPKYRDFLNNIEGVDFVESVDEIFHWNPDKVFSYNIANENIKVAKKCKRKRIQFFYVLHEPWDSFKELLSLRQRMPRRVAANIVNYLTAHYAYKVILASENGKKKYEKYMGRCNCNYDVFPLIFCDDYDASKSILRQYFSFIGGFTVMRGCNEFMSFIKYSIEKGLDYKFCIATRNTIDGYLQNDAIQSAIKDGILMVFSGKPMTTEEINHHYRESICSWNAYKSSTQSGVLPNALMQGSPVIVTDRGDSSDIITEKREGCFISLPHDNEEIKKAYDYISAHIEEMSDAARNKFHMDYEYCNYLDKARNVYEIKNGGNDDYYKNTVSNVFLRRGN